MMHLSDPADFRRPVEPLWRAIEALAVRVAGLPSAARFVALALAALLIFAPGQMAMPPTDRDEARFAQASKQMLETGDFLDIRFQQEARYNKPVGVYWLQAGAASLFGGVDAPIWAYRLPSLIASALAVALTAWAMTPLIGAGPAALAAALMAASLLLNVEARIAKTDATLFASILLAMGAMARVWFAQNGRVWVPLMWLAIGLSVLIKGPIVLIPMVGAALWLCLAERRAARLTALRPLAGLLIVVAIAGPWLVAITLASDGAFWTESVGRDLFGKVAGGVESHGAPLGYHTLALLGVFWPWAALAPFGLVWLWGRRTDPSGRFLLGWLALTWAVFELTPTKLPHYVLPAYPVIAAAVAAAIIEAARWASAPVWARRTLLGLWAIPAIALIGAALLGPVIIARSFSPGAIALALAAGVAAWSAAAALWRWRLDRFIAPAAATAALTYAAVLQFALPALTLAFPAPTMARASAEWRCGEAAPVALTDYREPSAIFLIGTDTVLTDGAGAAAAIAEGRASLAWIGDRNRPAFEAAAPGRPALETIEVFNYSNGRRMTLTLHGPAGREAPCDP
jgi:4-amino-4-deoxy-L-arabinose transferase-like glycosyltransferase